MIPGGYDFCPVCGLDQRQRFRRPTTQQLHIGGHSPPPAGGAPSVDTAPQAMPPGGSIDRTVPAPASGPKPRPPAPSFSPPAPPPPVPPPGGFPPPPPPVDRTVPAPSKARRPSRPPVASGRSSSLVDAVVDANTVEPPAGMPAVEADSHTDSAHTVPRAERSPAPAGDDDRTVPHPQMMRPVAISPVRAQAESATQPDRPGGFSGGPGHGPLPTVNRSSRRGTLAPGRPTAQQGSVNEPRMGGSGPRLVLVARDGSEGESFPISEEQLTIGRTHGDLLFPEDPFLSPMHVRLQRIERGMGIFDAGSTNGVYLRIRGSAPVYPGDQFMVGHQLLRLENIDTQVQESPPAIDGTRVFGTPLQPAWGCVRQVGRGGIVGDKYYLRGSQVVLGREGGDLLFPNDPFVSREHARLRLELHGQKMAVFLEDLESANGSYIRIRGSAELVSLDTFRIGDQILRLRLD